MYTPTPWPCNDPIIPTRRGLSRWMQAKNPLTSRTNTKWCFGSPTVLGTRRRVNLIKSLYENLEDRLVSSNLRRLCWTLAYPITIRWGTPNRNCKLQNANSQFFRMKRGYTYANRHTYCGALSNRALIWWRCRSFANNISLRNIVVLQVVVPYSF